MIPQHVLRNFFVLLTLLAAFSLTAVASTTDGTIDTTFKYSWGTNTGWLNWGTTGGNVHVTDSVLTGYAWSQNYGWINLNPTHGGVTNNGEGTLGGTAWGEELGWIYFSGVTIDSSGQFQGSATGTVVGTISFTCTNCKVVTDWRPQSVRSSSGGGSSGGGGGSTGGGGTGFYLLPFPHFTPETLPPGILAKCDFNSNGTCGLADLSIMLYYYNQSGPAIARYDLDGDGTVDFPDVSILLYYWDET